MADGEWLRDDQAADIIGEREALGRMVQDLFKAREDAETALIALTAGDVLEVDEAAVTFVRKSDGVTYRLALSLASDDDGEGEE